MNNVKGRHFGGEIALWAVRGYCRYPIGCRGPDVQHDEYRSRRHLPSDVVPVLRSFGEDCLKPLVNIRDRQQRRQRHHPAPWTYRPPEAKRDASRDWPRLRRSVWRWGRRVGGAVFLVLSASDNFLQRRRLSVTLGSMRSSTFTARRCSWMK